MRILRIVILVLLGVFIGIQMIRPERLSVAGDPLARFDRSTPAARTALAAIERSCLDCHSDTTDWPWYSNVAPVSWWVVDHVRHAHGHLNFSTWESYDAKKRHDLLEEICEETSENAMPLPSYTWIHRDAVLTSDEIKAICTWTRSM